MNNAINPYRQRGMIREPDDAFFGRARELRDAFTLLKKMQSVSVVGQRRIGKSSFLHRLATPRNGELDKSFTLHYLDLQRVFSAQEFYARACKKLDRETGDSHLDLEEAIQNRKVVFCLDEFEQAYEKDFGDEFFNALRSLAQTGNLALVVATQTPLNELHAQFLQDTDVTSKFHNIFTRLPLSEFTPEEARQMVETPRNGSRFNDDEVAFILQLGQQHPYWLNIACSLVYDAKRNGGLNRRKVEESFQWERGIDSSNSATETTEIGVNAAPKLVNDVPVSSAPADPNASVRLALFLSLIALAVGSFSANASFALGVYLSIALLGISLLLLFKNFSWRGGME